MEKIKIGITLGDINGIGPEVVIKALSENSLLKHITPIIYGNTKALSYHKNIVKGVNFNYMAIQNMDNLAYNKVNVVNCWEDNTEITLGESTKAGGTYARQALDRATDDLLAGKIHGLVTAPINKHAMHMADFPYPGHTEYLAKKLDAKKSLMMMVSDTLKVALVTNHLAIQEVAPAVNKELITSKINTLHRTLQRDFGIEKPVIAVLGLNPHAGDDGVIGSEEDDFIKPLIQDMKRDGKIVFGPYAADGFFGSAQFNKVDAILAMYHDQGLIPFKALSFGSGVNFTAGLPFVRTSPDHGTGYDIVGKNKADASSMRAAIYLALDAIRSRSTYDEDRVNPLDHKASQQLGREDVTGKVREQRKAKQ